VLWGAGGLLELINSCCGCDIPLEKGKQPARLKTRFPSLMHPPGPPPVVSPSAPRRGIACLPDGVPVDCRYPRARASESGKEGRPPRLLPPAGSWSCCRGGGPTEPTTALAQHRAPSAAATEGAGGARASVLPGERWQDLQRGSTGSPGRLSWGKSWAGWGGGGEVTARNRPEGCGCREVCVGTGSKLGAAWEPEGTCLAL